MRVLRLLLLFGAILAGGWAMSLVPAKFFPDSDRAQILVYLDMPAGTSMRKTDATVQAISKTWMIKNTFHILKNMRPMLDLVVLGLFYHLHLSTPNLQKHFYD